jgi:L-threonylcarbamoyladenylate synthase
VLGRSVRQAGEREGPRASGRLESHYAPRARVELALDAPAAAERATTLADAGERVGVLGAAAPPGATALGPGDDVAVLARVLYARLREADRLGLDVVVAVEPPPVGLGAAVADRLRRAAGPRGGGAGATPG